MMQMVKFRISEFFDARHKSYYLRIMTRCLLHHVLSLIAYTFRENREFVFIIIVQFMMSANIRIRFGLQIVVDCLYSIPSHNHHCANLSEGNELINSGCKQMLQNGGQWMEHLSCQLLTQGMMQSLNAVLFTWVVLENSDQLPGPYICSVHWTECRILTGVFPDSSWPSNTNAMGCNSKKCNDYQTTEW